MIPLSRRTLFLAGASALLSSCREFTSPNGDAAGTTDSQDIRVGRVIAPGERRVTPHVSGTTVAGIHLDTASWAGSPVIVNFWGSWCVPCREEAAELRRTALATMPMGAQFVGIDVRDDVEAARAFIDNFKIPYPSIQDQDGIIETTFGSAVPRAVPTTHVLDAKGRIAAQFIGKITYASLQPTVLQLLTETNPKLATIAPVSTKS